MAKKETSPELTEEFKKTLAMTKMLDVEVDNELKRSFIAYAMAVNKSRAIPDVRDGLKPVHRRILFSMHEMAGDICACVGFKDIRTGDTLCSEEKPIVLESMTFPDPVTCHPRTFPHGVLPTDRTAREVLRRGNHDAVAEKQP